jgi:hypothetical protein
VEWEKQKAQLADLVVEINKPLKKLDRATLITLCTIDVHARDVLGRLIDDRVEDATCFQWQSQLRYLQHEKTKKCQVLLVFTIGFLPSHRSSIRCSFVRCLGFCRILGLSAGFLGGELNLGGDYPVGISEE